MELILLSLVLTFGGYIMGIGLYLDSIHSIEERHARAQALFPDPGKANDRTWPRLYLSTFDRVFSTVRHLPRFVARSALASTLWLGLFGLLNYDRFYDVFGMLWSRMSHLELLVIVVGVLAVNYTADFLSLLETRYLLSKAPESPNRATTHAILLADVFLSGFLGSVATGVFFIFTTVSMAGNNPPSEFLAYDWTFGFKLLVGIFTPITLIATDPNENAPYLVFFWSAFISSFWLWGFYLTRGVHRIFQQRLTLLSGWLHTRQRIRPTPFSTIAFILATAVVICFCLVLVARSVFGTMS